MDRTFSHKGNIFKANQINISPWSSIFFMCGLLRLCVCVYDACAEEMGQLCNEIINVKMNGMALQYFYVLRFFPE